MGRGERLEAAIDRWNEELGPLENFILPGGSALIALMCAAAWRAAADGVSGI
jgi:cob(I)alamin adenosyltransferase